MALSLDLKTLRAAYVQGRLTPRQLVAQLDQRWQQVDDPAIYLHRLCAEELEPYLQRLEQQSPVDLPLYGIPFAIKDNIDLAGVPTTASCADYRYVPEESAHVVQRLIDLGALPLGKTNLDQFATGLVGVRSPFGVPRNAYSAEHIPGGSSSGSAAAVAQGLASFSLGTDTAGSGRVPAAFNHLYGVKPTRGLLSALGVVPACRSLDCVSIFALNAADSRTLLELTADYDPKDAYARPARSNAFPQRPTPVIGIVAPEQCKFFGNAEYERLYRETLARLEAQGVQTHVVDFEPFAEAARLLYEGPWVSERYCAIQELIERNTDALHPVTRKIIGGGANLKATDLFKSLYRLEALKREVERVWRSVDALLTPTAGTIYTRAEVEADPVQTNSNLGFYTNFMNLLDCCALAAPAGFTEQGLPFGVTLVGPAFSDRRLLDLCAQLPLEPETTQPIVVCGAHLQGLPLNWQLTELGATLQEATRTAPVYRAYALPGSIAKPGIVRVPEGGAALDVEVWDLPKRHWGTFAAQISPPLGLGWVELADGRRELGFLCESIATTAAKDITANGGWRAYLQATQS
ncbi:MAG: allophanate hydrolase [Verrucomicrobiota bacterium JB022]|nr:allophanate hydrolase [Verrucomicrobiota bacterium JB022]